MSPCLPTLAHVSIPIARKSHSMTGYYGLLPVMLDSMPYALAFQVVCAPRMGHDSHGGHDALETPPFLRRPPRDLGLSL